MKSFSFPKWLCMSLLVWNCCLSASVPNIVWIMSDDLGWGEVGTYPSTSPHGRIATPHLDTFARQGISFRDAYAGYTVCAPSRNAFFSGRNSGHFGPTVTPLANWTLLPEVLKNAGYNTAAIGKSAPLDLPTTRGFDYFWGQSNQAACHNMYPVSVETASSTSVKSNTVVELPLNHKEKNRELCMANPSSYNYTTDAFHSQALDWLDQQTPNKPFFLYMSYTVPHAGGWGDSPQDPETGAPVPTDLQYASQSWPDVEKDHAAAITYMDNLIGEILTKLAKIGADNNTLIFFASDNGAHNEGGHSHLFFNSTGGLRGFKRSFYEGGIRSPSMVLWPGVAPAGTISNFPWAFWDVLPTICDILQVPVPASASDGQSILPSLRGQTQKPPVYQYWTWKSSKISGYSARVGNWKVVAHECPKGQPSDSDLLELYDLTVDSHETTNIAADHPKVIASIKNLLISQNLHCKCYQC